MAYTVPKLADYSAAALEGAVTELLSALKAEADTAWNSEAEWKAFRDRWLARRSGILTLVNDLWLKTAPKEAKREVGRRVNEIRIEVEHAVEKTEELYLEWQTGAQPTLASNAIDISLPGVRRPIGAEHPVIRTSHEIVSIS